MDSSRLSSDVLIQTASTIGAVVYPAFRWKRRFLAMMDIRAPRAKRCNGVSSPALLSA
jgi:hypothetical protein